MALKLTIWWAGKSGLLFQRTHLPYLVWYGNPNYCRVPTVDYRTAIFDVSINGPANGNKTPYSWRTILIGTMGFGGEFIKAGTETFSSSVFALDLTDWLNGTSTHLDCTSTYPSVGISSS
jgi:type IV pilus assembly protein PilY1